MTPLVKPRLRGIPDVLGVIVAFPAVIFLIHYAAPGLPTVASAVYGASLIVLLSASATYHTPHWPRPILLWLKRVDHAAIFVLIAGTYTPVCLLLLPKTLGFTVLTVTWIVAAIGILISLLWPTAPRAITVPMYLGVGWAIVPWTGDIFAAAGPSGLALMGAGGLFYTIGALTYMKRWPNPLPKTYGYHEVFHTFMLTAAACHMVFVWGIVT